MMATEQITLLRIWRESLGLSPEDVASAVGVSRATVDNWEHGRGGPKPAQIARMAELGPGLLKALGLE
jgi:transcriptional regulator with XRE-family HTH domain